MLVPLCGTLLHFLEEKERSCIFNQNPALTVEKQRKSFFVIVVPHRGTEFRNLLDTCHCRLPDSAPQENFEALMVVKRLDAESRRCVFRPTEQWVRHRHESLRMANDSIRFYARHVVLWETQSTSQSRVAKRDRSISFDQQTPLDVDGGRPSLERVVTQIGCTTVCLRRICEIFA